MLFRENVSDGSGAFSTPPIRAARDVQSPPAGITRQADRINAHAEVTRTPGNAAAIRNIKKNV
jgi:hypothetical protein